MAWFKSKNVFSDLEGLKKDLAANPDPNISELGKQLKMQDFPACWDILKEILPLLEKNKRRDLVRILFANEASVLTDLLSNRQERELAIECLGYIPNREVIEILAQLLSHKDDAVQLMAAGALQNHTPRLVVPILLTGLLEETIAAARAGQVLLTMGFYAQEIILEVYPQASNQVKARLLEIMRLDENPKCLPFVEEALRSTEPVLKKKALEAVEAFNYTESWTEVVMCLAEDDWSLRAKALEVLAKLQVRDALEFIEPFLQDSDSWVRQCAADCISSLQAIRERSS